MRRPRGAAVGEMRWDGQVWRRWSGRGWERAAYSLDPRRLRLAVPISEEAAVERAQRDRALALAVEDQVASHGASVVLDGPSGVVLAYPRQKWHAYDAVLTVLTAGMWSVVWLARVLAAPRRSSPPHG